MIELTNSHGSRRPSKFAAWGPWVFLSVGAAWSIWSWSTEGVVHDLLRTDLDAAAQIERLGAQLERFGLWAPAVYVALVTVETVVAPVPGLLLYAPAGMIFGPLAGGALSLAGNILGAGVACRLGGGAAGSVRERLLSTTRSRRMQCELERRGARWVFWLRLNPLTSSDLVSYAAGIAGLPARQVMAATAVGMLPLCFLQAYFSYEIFRAVPALLYPFAVLCLVYAGAAVYFARRHFTSTAAEPSSTSL